MSVKYNLVYMAKPTYGGWVSFTAHLANKKKYDLYKITNRSEKSKRNYGYGIQYQNLNIDDLVKKPNLLITAIDKNYYKYLPKILNATIVIHDPTELKDTIVELLQSKKFKVITIRRTVEELLKTKYNINNTFLHHPFYAFPKPINKIKKNNNISLSRIDFDKHTDIILKANNKLKNPVKIYGAVNGLYVYHKLSKMEDINFKKHYKGKFSKTFDALIELLGNTKFVVDMSAINKDGGGSQYTFLEAIYMDCVLVLNKKWVNGVVTDFIDGVNCFIVENDEDIIKLLNENPITNTITYNANKLLKHHLIATGW